MKEDSCEFFEPMGKMDSINTTQDNGGKLPTHEKYETMETKVKLTNIREDIIYIPNKDEITKEFFWMVPKSF